MHKVEKIFTTIHDEPLNLSRKRIVIQQLEDGLSDIDPAELLTLDETPEHLIIREPDFYEEEEYELPMLPITTMSIDEDGIPDVHERVIHWLPRDVCLVGSILTNFIRLK
jgi:hypothetical protein